MSKEGPCGQYSGLPRFEKHIKLPSKLLMSSSKTVSKVCCRLGILTKVDDGVLKVLALAGIALTGEVSAVGLERTLGASGVPFSPVRVRTCP